MFCAELGAGGSFMVGVRETPIEEKRREDIV